MKTVNSKFALIIAIMFSFCKGSKERRSMYDSSVEMITSVGKQDSIFAKLMSVTNDSIPESVRADSLSFLVLSMNAACPACRNKAIDSIVKYKDKLDQRHIIILSSNGYRKLRSYFLERGTDIPLAEKKIFVDTSNMAYLKDLVFANPRIYHSFKMRAYRKISCEPSTIKENLSQFFRAMR